MTLRQIAVSYTTEDQEQKARQLAEKLNLPLLSTPEQTYDYVLICTPNYLGLQTRGQKPFYIDFLGAKLLYRCQHASLKKELLARAIGAHPRENPRIIDTTAGLGRDSFMLAYLGFHITMIERSPILHALLEDAMIRAKLDPAIAKVIARMQLVNADSIDWLTTAPIADIIYLDPMFPERKKSASVKKEMALLQDLLEKDENTEILFRMALTCAKLRVVVKRPRLAESISNQKPGFSLIGKSSRFDVYINL